MTRADFRIAFRVEGEMWNAYVARNDSMDGAILLGSVRMDAVANNVTLKENFMLLMKETLESAIAGVKLIEWPDPPEPAPEHERAGRA